MAHASPRCRALFQTAGAVGAVALPALGAAPAGAADSDAPNLALGGIGPIDGVEPGSERSLPGSFTNTGTAALDKVWMAWSVTLGLGFSPTPSNCSTQNLGGADEMPKSSVMVCEFDGPVDPGVVYAPEGLKLRVRDSALNDELAVRVSDSRIETGTGEEGPPDQGTGPAVKLVKRPDETPAAPGSTGPAWSKTDVTAKSTADFQVTGARLKGKVGDTVPLTVKFTNAGPGWVAGEPYASVTHVLVKMPAGTTVTQTSCKSQGQGTYDCGTYNSWVYADSETTYTFKLKIDKAVAGAKGSVALEEKSRPFDPVKSNDRADILLDIDGDGTDATGGGSSASGGSSTGGSGGSGTDASGGSGSASGTGSTSGSGSASGSGTSATGGDSASGSSGSSSTGGGLAATGSGSALPLAAAAAGAVVLGAGGVLAARRRAARQR
ncbi:hypothetical protein [Streptomyces sp. ITFR-6]|uniref:hypothetical protein n=1 Tax=Streptomyces sp. ITFR-6 TaxID=3075197 RepID=UPI00288BCA74|nr:hypothetical protein [Streptomyces sp. ITFR-6]WNI29589.1 hypothetical protein RLT59_12930 [Streptomyces sp. ITFR-6]